MSTSDRPGIFKKGTVMTWKEVVLAMLIGMAVGLMVLLAARTMCCAPERSRIAPPEVKAWMRYHGVSIAEAKALNKVAFYKEDK